MKPLYRSYSDYLGENAIDYINKQIVSQFDESHYKNDQFHFIWSQQLGIILTENFSLLTINELLDIFSSVLLTKIDPVQGDSAEKESIFPEEFQLLESEFIWLNKLLPQAAIC